MYLAGHAPLPGEYAFMALDELARERARRRGRARAARGRLREREPDRARPRDPRTSAPFTIDIDHHHDNTRFGDVNLIVADASSTGGGAARRASRELGVELTPEIAEALYIALVTDTGRFQYANTTPKALRLAAELVEAGADVHRVFQGVYENVQFAKLKLLARALERAQVYEGGALVVSYLLRGDFAEVGAAEPYSEGIIDYLRAVEGAIVSVLIREPPRSDGPTRRVSLRSSTDEVDVSAIARKSGGGGHRQAAGFSSELSIEEITDFIRREYRRAGVVCRRALEPAGIVARSTSRRGPSSFAVIAELRRRTGARTGHAGTLDPFATGLLLVFSGWATKLQPCFVGLDKRYVTEVDLTATTATGDPEGEVVERHEPPTGGRARGTARRASAARSSCRSRPPRR